MILQTVLSGTRIMKISEKREQWMIDNFYYLKDLYIDTAGGSSPTLYFTNSKQIQTIWKFFNEMDNIDKTPENLIMFLKLS